MALQPQPLAVEARDADAPSQGRCRVAARRAVQSQPGKCGGPPTYARASAATVNPPLCRSGGGATQDEHRPRSNRDAGTSLAGRAVRGRLAHRRVECVDLRLPLLTNPGFGEYELDRLPPGVDHHEEVVVDEPAAIGGAVGGISAVEVDRDSPGCRIGPLPAGHDGAGWRVRPNLSANAPR